MKLPHIFRKNIVLFPLIAIVAVGIGIASTLLLNKDSSPNGANCTGICVSIRADGINPSELAVKAGEFVQFNSADGESHNLTTAPPSDKAVEHGHSSASAVSSGEFGADEAWRVQFKKPGTYRLRDSKNANQEILVVVYEPKN